MKKFFVALIAALAIASCLALCACDSGSDVVLDIDKANETVSVNKDLYGLFIEDISYAGDGGLVSELVQNGSFEYAPDKLAAWRFEGAKASVSTSSPLNDKNPSHLVLSVGGDIGRLINIGYPEYYDYPKSHYNAALADTPDMGFEEGAGYRLSFYARGLDGYPGSVSAMLFGVDGAQLSDEVAIDAAAQTESAYPGWDRYEVVLTSDVTADGGLEILFEGAGEVELDFVSLVPTDAYGSGSEQWKYVTLREDLVKALYDLSPGFIRFPGGCLAEGDDLDRLFSWKNTIGPLEEREHANNIWRDESIGKSYNNTFALGYHEYFQLCEDLGAEPLPILNVGMICQFEFEPDYRDTEADYRKGKLSEEEWNDYLDKFALRPGTAEFDAYTQDILDLIEYCNGDATTTWGAVRAASGHPEPFDLKYIGLGNENWGDVYWRNFDALYNAVKEAYPDITVISSASYQFTGDYIDESWDIIAEKYPDTIVDEHYYTSGNKLFANNDRYDDYDRDGAQVFVGEYAATPWGIGTDIKANNMWSAIEEAGYLTSLERNGDIVKWASYAPTFAKLNAHCWELNMIWFDSHDVVLTPNYFVQLMYSNNTGTKFIATDGAADIKTSTTIGEDGTLFVKLVNESSKPREVTLDVADTDGGYVGWSNVFIDGVKAACNEPGSTTVAPEVDEGSVSGGAASLTVKPYSVNVIRIYREGADVWMPPALPAGMGEKTEYDDFFVDPYDAIAWGVSAVVVIAAAVGTAIAVAIKKKRAARGANDAQTGEE